MSEERVMLKSKIPVKATSGIPVRINVNKSKKSDSVLHKATESRNKSGLAGQDATSKEKFENVQWRPKLSTNKTLKTKQPNLVKNKISTKQSVKETDRARLKVNNSSKTVSKNCKVVKASTPVPLVKTRIKVQPTKSKNVVEFHPSRPAKVLPTKSKNVVESHPSQPAKDLPTKSKNVVESHPSQPDIEFVPDELSRKRILGCIELPSASNAMARGQASIYDRPSLYRLNPIARPSDPCKALMKTLQSLKVKDRRETFQSTNWRESLNLNRPSVNKIGLKPPDFTALKTLENIDCEDWSSLKQSGVQATFGNKCFPLARKTPKMVLEEAKRRLEQKQKEDKSVKKVTFQVLNSAIGKENKCHIESKPTDDKHKEKFLETPDPKPGQTSCKKDETPHSPLFAKNASKESQAASSLSSILAKKPVSILKNKIFPEMDVRRGSLFCSRPMRTGPAKMRRSISFSDIPPVCTRRSTIGGNVSNDIRIQVQGRNPVSDLKPAGQQLSPGLSRRSISSPEFSALCSSIAAARAEAQACSALPPGRGSILKLRSFQTNDLVDRLRSSVSASGLRGSLFLSNNPREVQLSNKPKLCTPVPVSLYPRSQTTDSFSPEFLCPRTSNYIADAPIKTPLVLKNLAEREENDDDDFSQVRKKLNFLPPAEVPKQNALACAAKQNKSDFMVDQECNTILYKAIFPYICSQNILNPIAKILENGDEMHFIPVSPCP